MTEPGKPHIAPVSQLLYQSIVWRGLFFASSFVLNILFARIYEASVSGWVFYTFSYYTLFINLLGFSLESGIGFYAARKEIAPGKLAWFSVAMTVLAGILVFVIFHFYIPQPLLLVPVTFVLITAVAYICGSILTAYSNGIFFAGRDFRTPSLVNIGMNMILVLILVINGKPDPGENPANSFFIQFFFYSIAVQGLVLTALLIFKYKVNSFTSAKEIQKIWRYSLQAMIANLLFFLFYRVDYWFVEHYCSASDLGNYIQVSKIGQIFFTLPSIIGNTIFPLTAGGQQEEVNRNLKGISLNLLFLNGTLCLLLAVTGYWLFPFIYGESFRNMYVPFLFLVPGILSLSTLYPYAAYYAGKNRISVNIKGSLYALIIIISGDLLFIPHYGIKSAAIISSIGYLAYQVFVMRVYKKEYRIRTMELLAIRIKDATAVKRFILQQLSGRFFNQEK